MQKDVSNRAHFSDRLQNRPIIVFFILWLIVFALYLPAAKAGFVTDFTGWLDQVRNHPFWEYINRTNFSAKSLYQFTQFNTYIFYKIFGAHPLLWHLLFVTLQALNGCLLFRLCSKLFLSSGIKNATGIAFTGVCLFCISPYLSEVIVWEPSFHFLQGLLLILIILLLLQRFFQDPKIKYAWLAGIVFLLSTFSLEVFYITPWMVLTLASFHKVCLGRDKKIFHKALSYFFMPQLILFAGRVFLYRAIYGGWVSRIGTSTVTGVGITDFGKPAKYLFHIVFLGRFFSTTVRQHVYSFCDSVTGIVIFYSLVAIVFLYIAFRFHKMSGKAKSLGLIFTWTMMTLAVLIPLWFNDIQYVIFDRYTYFTDAFAYMALALLFSYITMRWLYMLIVGLYALANIRFTIMVSRYWGKSEKIIHALLRGFPPTDNKTVILLNLPESFNGTPMIGSTHDGEFRLMYNLLMPEKKLNGSVYDAASFNMSTPSDGAHVTVLNDTTVRVTLNQWGTWWWYDGKGGGSYSNKDYKLNMIDGGHFYELTLKHPASGYILLYEVGDKWKAADWNKKNVEQD